MQAGHTAPPHQPGTRGRMTHHHIRRHLHHPCIHHRQSLEAGPHSRGWCDPAGQIHTRSRHDYGMAAHRRCSADCVPTGQQSHGNRRTSTVRRSTPTAQTGKQAGAHCVRVCSLYCSDPR
jgi:hypothetical protein